MTQQLIKKFCTMPAVMLVLSPFIAACQAADKTLMNQIASSTHNGVYSLFDLIFSRNGAWVLLALAALVAYLFWRKS